MFFARKPWGSNFTSPEPKFGSNFQKLSLESIDRQRVTQHNIDLIIFKDSTVNFMRVKGAVSTSNTFSFIKNARKHVLGLFFSYQSPKSHYLPSVFNLLYNIFLFPCFCEILSTHMVEMPFSILYYYCETQGSLFGLQGYQKTHRANLI